jgi:hypothetical protein
MIDYKNRIVLLAITGLMMANPCRVVAVTEVSQLIMQDTLVDSSVEPNSTDRRLGALLADIRAQSDVRIIAPAALADDEVGIVIDATDWNSTIRTLLKNYNHLAIIDRAGNYRKIWITARDESRRAEDSRNPSSLARTHSGRHHDEPDPLTELPVAIWQPVEVDDTSVFSESDIPHASVQMDPSFFDSLQVGRPIEIPVPQESEPYFGVVGETHDQLSGAVQVWSGPIDGAHESASFTMTRGRISTYVTIATGSSIYEAVVDNATGVGSVVNEVDMTKGKDEHDALIPTNVNPTRE